MNSKIILLWISVLSLSSFCLDGSEIKPPKVDLTPCKIPPKVDGKLDDACWKNAYTCKEFYLYKNPGERVKDTVLKVTADPEYLYFGVKCFHPAPKDMKVTQLQNNQGRVFGDECVKMLINPGLDEPKIFRYVLNPANTSKLNNQIGKSPKWKFRQISWPSATNIDTDGWSAEIAVPLVYLAAYGDLSKFRMNLFRRRIDVVRDSNGVVVDEKDNLRNWAPLYQRWIEEENQARIAGLGKIMKGRAFLAAIRKASISEIYQKDGKNFIDVKMTLMPLTHKSGWVTVKVEDCPEKGKATARIKKIRCYRSYNDVKFTLPVAEIGPREIKITVYDKKTGGVMEKKVLASKIQMRAFLDRTYYTTEKQAGISCEITYPGKNVKGKLTLASADGKIKKEIEVNSLRPEMSLPLENVALGSHRLKLIFSIAGREIFKTGLTLRKLAPKPGLEWKVDRVNRVILKNGKPFLPFGVWGHCTEKMLKEYQELGLNMIAPMGLKYIQKTPEKVAGAMRLARKYGIHLTFRPTVFSKPEKNAVIDRLVANASARRRLYTRNPGANYVLMTKALLATDPFLLKLTRQARNEIFEACFKGYRDTLKKCIELTRNEPGLLAWVNIDEPCLNAFDIDIVLRKIYTMINELDGYHPVFALYSAQVPNTPRATEDVCDVLGVDPYWTPGAPEGSYRWNIDFVAKCTALLNERCKQDRLVNWVTPVSSSWSSTHKRPINGKELVCQTYLALIYGAKAISYYLYNSVSHQEQFDAFKRLGRDMKALTPALLSPDVPGKVIYKPGMFNPHQNIYPDVHAGLFRNPGKGYLLLAANSKNYPVSVSITVPGIRGEVKNIFGGKTLAVKNNAFNERLEPMEVRAYSIPGLKVPAMIQVAAKRLPGGFSVEKGYPYSGRKGQKNILPNGGFEECSLPDWPDYYRVRGTPSPRIGNPGCPWGSYPDQPYEGKKCLRSKGKSWGFYISPQNSKPEKYCFSIYMRTDKPGTTVNFRYLKHNEKIKVAGKKWKQYSFIVKVPARAGRLSAFRVNPANHDATIWFDAASFEKIQMLSNK